MSVAGPLGRNLENVMKMLWTKVCDDSSQLADTDMRRPTVILPDFLLGKSSSFCITQNLIFCILDQQ